MSALVRAHRLTRDPHMLEVARAAAEVFGKDLGDGESVRKRTGTHCTKSTPGFHSRASSTAFSSVFSDCTIYGSRPAIGRAFSSSPTD